MAAPMADCVTVRRAVNREPEAENLGGGGAGGRGWLSGRPPIDRPEFVFVVDLNKLCSSPRLS